MAAIKLDANAVSSGTDVSYPAVWLPFQDMTTNNHLAQWAQQSFDGACPVTDGGAPLAGDAGGCSGGLCCFNGGCATCVTPPPPPPATCSSTPNCAPGSCCIGGSCTTVGCPDAGSGADAGGADGGVPDAGGGIDSAAPVDTGTPGCQTCLDCNGQACINGACGSCTNSSQCCAPLVCQGGTCVEQNN
jgi:hypothetical protein